MNPTRRTLVPALGAALLVTAAAPGAFPGAAPVVARYGCPTTSSASAPTGR
ncbi:hypothetical protein ACFQ6N_28490 [Kitasatospora sp. NPDC056446]|uniref:hypothetical protein n=1 Tax=Kitasatospora sp. NPDC056446 TaxID=3345819 RepID=UPI00368056D7